MYAVQGDKNSRIVHIELVAGNFEWNIPDGAKVLVKFLKPDGKAGLFDKLPDGTTASTFEPGKNKVDITLAPQMLTAAGKVESQVSFIYDDNIISTFTFNVFVQADPSASHDVSTDYVNWDKVFMPQATDTKVGEYLQVVEVDEHGRAKKISSKDVFENLEEIKLSDIDGSVSLRIDSRSSEAGFHNVLLIDSDNQSVDGGTVLSGISKGTGPLDAVNRQQLDESLEDMVSERDLDEILSDYVTEDELRDTVKTSAIPQTSGASVGQYLKITKVDNIGRVVSVAPVDAPSGSGVVEGSCSGIHVGADEPADDNIVVWIDPESEDTSLLVEAPATANVGQTIVVKAVDENGTPVAWEAADLPDSYSKAQIDTIMGSYINDIDALIGGDG